MSEFVNTNGNAEQLDPSDYSSHISRESKAGKSYLDDLTEKKIRESRSLGSGNWHENKEERVLEELKDDYHANEDQYVAVAKQEYADEQEKAQKEAVVSARAEVDEVLKKAA